MLNIWGRISSINVRKVVWCAQELGLDFQRTEAGGKFGIVQTPEYLGLNPNALVPAIDDGEGEDRVVLWESNVIVRYLCAKHSTGKLYPERLAARFDAERWMDWQQTTLNPVSAGAFRQWVRTPSGQRDPAVIAHSVNATEPLFALLDAHLATRAFMLGDSFTMADIPIGCEAHRWFGLPQTEYTRPVWPHVERWFADLRSRAGARGVLDLALE
ncbi:glutathione S-transferase family protein [Variovorax sp. MHTC-1]|uniref:glutathione S-transferase family protein n=1 Tax=Variovorax sp. MHTC-1 TaxID=2495593 RepID=UPI000F889600|nr:glutathione S-transferase [Variovorax sp. MHTC-1]RST49191.1 glutathione S-transferase [Variovorax sp. MHTC-1]